MSHGQLSSEAFQSVIDLAPLVSIDLIIRDKISGCVLLGRRKNRPAQGYWFVPGGRVRKNESLADAFNRLTREELGFSCSLEDSELLGVYEHFYADSAFGGAVTTHYVVIGRLLVVDTDDLDLPLDQHSGYRWFEPDELLGRDEVHPYTKDYFL